MSDRKYLITKSTSIAPIHGPHPVWSKFLDETTQGDKDFQRFLQQMCGYFLTGETNEHALFFVYGTGGNGKSVFLNTITNILGDYAVTAPMDVFTAGKSDRHPTELAMLRGARLVAVSETEEGRAWKESQLKSLTGGDKITARFMRQDFFTYKPQFKLLIVGNHKPKISNVDEAIKRRIYIVPFVHKPLEPDKYLEDKLRLEYPQILHWMIEGLHDWQSHGLIRPAVVQAATDEYFETQDFFGHWLEDNCEFHSSYKELATPLFENWKAYAERKGERPGTTGTLSERLLARGFTKERTRNGIMYFGLALKNAPTSVLYPVPGQPNFPQQI